MTSVVRSELSAAEDVMLPYRVVRRTLRTRDTVTLLLRPVHRRAGPFRAGQFMMLYSFGVGEVAISLSGDPTAEDGLLEHTIRTVGAVSRALSDTSLGGLIGVRGPFGTGWDVEAAAGGDIVVVGGGLGLAPLRPLVLAVLAARADYRRVTVITGARSPAEVLFGQDQDRWAHTDSVDVLRTVDHPCPGWTGRIGFVTEPLAQLDVDPARTTGFLCGPEPMMRFCAQTLLGKKVPGERIRVSLERNMKCGVARCGHCQLGPLLLCRDGPIVDYAVAEPLLAVREL
ncbi:FAD/NAD(P)-binding protein [Nocardia rhamnosiphila]|uniref:FAD/NAD(P)-binding protein n=1 Tax=Nocardia rhamnosiphila TaxID=426716 RepID=A0ABV2WPT7_9NOCA